MHTTWTTLPDTGARVLLDERGVPRILLLRQGDDHTQVKLEVEARHGWRTETETLTSHDNPRGWLLAVTWAGKLAVTCTYNEVQSAPVRGYGHHDLKCDVGRLTGMPGVSVVNQLSEEWRGHRRGTYVVWASHPGAVGFVVEVGVHSTLVRLALASLPRVENDSEAGG